MQKEGEDIVKAAETLLQQEILAIKDNPFDIKNIRRIFGVALMYIVLFGAKNVKRAYYVYLLVLLFLFVGLGCYFVWYDFSVSFHIAFWMIGGIGFVLCSAYLIGWCIPELTVNTANYVFNAPIELVWSIVTDYENKASWYPGIVKTEKIGSNPEIWRLFLQDDIEMEIVVIKKVALQETQEGTIGMRLKNSDCIFCEEYENMAFSSINRSLFKSENGITLVNSTNTVRLKNPMDRFLATLMRTHKQVQKSYSKKIAARIEYLKTQGIS